VSGNGNGNGRGEEMTAQEIRDKFKIPYSTVNHYTNLGLFSIVRKNGNKRIYDREEVENRFEVISKLSTEGYPLGLIRKKIMGEVKSELL
jgi:DNA-binding transcriptional MerR regulator